MKTIGLHSVLMFANIGLLLAFPAVRNICSEVTTHFETKVTFKSGPDTLYGTVLLPNGAENSLDPSRKFGAALIISGSGPSDRNSNSKFYPHLESNCNFARTLADSGIASFRYDKLGSGETGIATHANGSGIDYRLFEQEAVDAYRVLSQQDQVDDQNLMILGHSEGGLFALRLAHLLKDERSAPRALILAAPLGRRYLDVIQRQLDQQISKAQEAGSLSPDQAGAMKEELGRLVEQLRTKGTVPQSVNPAFAAIFSKVNAAFLHQADSYDPAKLAATLPEIDLSVLVIRGLKDLQVDKGDVDHLMTGFGSTNTSNVQRFELPDTDHIFKTILGEPNPAKDYADPTRPFSPQAIKALKHFLEALKRHSRGL